MGVLKTIWSTGEKRDFLIYGMMKVLGSFSGRLHFVQQFLDGFCMMYWINYCMVHFGQLFLYLTFTYYILILTKKRKNQRKLKSVTKIGQFLCSFCVITAQISILFMIAIYSWWTIYFNKYKTLKQFSTIHIYI